MIDYAEHINTLLQPTIDKPELVLDLFAGCGGLSLGFEAAGYQTVGYEMDAAACDTYNKNLKGECLKILLNSDFEFPHADVIIGGPPCQPFSVGGHQKGIKDSRDGFPIFIAAVRQVRPKFFLFENVRGLLYSNKWYFDEIISELAQLNYKVEFQLLNAVRHGVPQNRERLFVVGHKSQFTFPRRELNATTVGEALFDTLNKAPEGSKFLTSSMDAYIAKYEKASKCINPRDLDPKKPARTLTCRNLAGATGDMQRLLLPDGKRRRLLASEAARLQSFPDWFQFAGNETQVFNQIGNAVPPLLAYKLAESMTETLMISSTESQFNSAAPAQTETLTLFP
jgi:DNA (cytosine-5)-methyltransferase 1